MLVVLILFSLLAIAIVVIVHKKEAVEEEKEKIEIERKKEEQEEREKQAQAQHMAELREKKRLLKEQREAKRKERDEKEQLQKIEDERKAQELENERIIREKTLLADLKNAGIQLGKPKDENYYYLITDEYFDIDLFAQIFNSYDIDLFNFDWAQFHSLLKDTHGLYVTIKSSTGSLLSFRSHLYFKTWKVVVENAFSTELDTYNELKAFVQDYCQIERHIASKERMENILEYGSEHAIEIHSEALDKETYFTEILMESEYFDLFKKSISVTIENNIALVEYDLPNKDSIYWIKDYKYIKKDLSIKVTMLPESVISKTYENLLYSICLRSMYEMYTADKDGTIQSAVFNGYVTSINKANGHEQRVCILSLQASKANILSLDLKNIDPKTCFKSMKGVSAAKLADITPIQPVLTFNKKDKRFIEGKDIKMNSGTNLASMDWEDFEHLVRELFEMEFSKNGGDVKVTQASRDGGVDAIAFDPDPIRGGKIVIQAKRYTNTVGVAAVRDLYGTVINEGANTGILITTSDYGHDSYEFAKDKPLKLLNGGHLLALLQKNGMKGYINIQEAKDKLKEDKDI